MSDLKEKLDVYKAREADLDKIFSARIRLQQKLKQVTELEAIRDDECSQAQQGLTQVLEQEFSTVKPSQKVLDAISAGDYDHAVSLYEAEKQITVAEPVDFDVHVPNVGPGNVKGLNEVCRVTLDFPNFWHEGYGCSTFLPNNELLVFQDRKLSLLNVDPDYQHVRDRKIRLPDELYNHDTLIHFMSSSNDGHYVALGSGFGDIMILSRREIDGTYSLVMKFDQDQITSFHEGPVTAMTVSPDGKTIAKTHMSGCVEFFKMPDMKKIKKADTDSYVTNLAFLPDNQHVIVQADDGYLVLDHNKEKLMSHKKMDFCAPGYHILCFTNSAIAVNKSGSMLAEASLGSSTFMDTRGKGKLKLFSIDDKMGLTKVVEQKFEDHNGGYYGSDIESISFTPDDKCVAVTLNSRKDPRSIVFYELV